MRDFQEQCQVHGQQCQVRGQRGMNGFSIRFIKQEIEKLLEDKV